jgi:Tol biopolymer transport system component
MLRLRGLVAVALASLLPGCSSEHAGFGNTNATIPIRPGSRLIFTGNGFAPRGGSPREVFSAEETGASVNRLTFCNNSRPCDMAEGSPAPDRNRVAIRRVTDTDSDGRLTAADGASLVIANMSRSEESTIVLAGEMVTAVDWSPVSEVLVFVATGEGGLEDMWRIDSSGQNRGNLTQTANVAERRPRIDPTGSVAAFERVDETGKGQIYIYNSSVNLVRVTTGGPGTERLAGTPYIVGGDTDPDYSPDGGSIVFRRLTGTGNSGLGTWDVMTVRTDGTGLTAIASGPAFRGAPDWGPQGIVFPEIDRAASGGARLVLVAADGSGRRTPVTLGPSFDLSYPRWLAVE